ncbi:MAG TPA: sulfate/molybdate ABC transporter ATP-binding protein [Caulobacteraceae bacterium]|nr:sulfate/molybdate ABC transporter ATP-binding protein [Caulobacteraceae bacterium]
MTISIDGIEKRFGRYPALNGVSLEIGHGELLALLGPSGSGKTTLLRLIAGLEFPDRGQVLFDRQDVTYLHAAARQVGFVFQQYALFKHMTVARNVAFGLDVRRKGKPPRAEINLRVDELLKLVELSGTGPRYPSQLSGGQRQRVALARALAVSPRVLLLDEPFGALDATVRKSLRRELRRIHDATGVTTIFVTHDQEEALELADRVAVLNHGKIEQIGAPAEVHDNPVSAFVCGFVGESNRFEGRVARGVFSAGPITASAPGVVDGAAVAFVRPHELVIAGPEEGFETHVGRVIPQGPIGRIETQTADGRWIEANFARAQLDALAPGAPLRLAVTQAHVFPAALPVTTGAIG